MSTPLTFSLRVNNDLDSAQYLALARAAEDAGIDQLWVSNDLTYRFAPALVGAAAATTSRLKLGIGLMNPYSVHPAELAMLAATMQELSDGRFLLGLGAGSGRFLEWIGIDQTKPLSRTREALRAIRALTSGGSPGAVEGAGVGWQEDARLRFAASDVPIYVGAMSPKMLEFAGAEADGVLALLFPPEEFSSARARILAGAHRAGRSAADLDIPACVWLSLSDSRADGDRALALKLAYYGNAFSPHLLGQAGLAQSDFDPAAAALARGEEDAAVSAIDNRMLSLGISGDVDAVLARCRSLIAAGTSHLSFGPPIGPDLLEAVSLLGSEVLPRLRKDLP
ncbi:LLM class flavin-dependent oxidoreductase [Demequina sp. NBRC 110054]|uniref:LLM class flavin-dependent oxidoreductase n=1 Tax=Demequina sp. NBRC 110054 TaxID=1570343 RepID=UPI000A04DC90|nr:LLM class flavin-dependent oxidoreductase [Demequina sp. NBRC 110054]